MHHRRVRGLLSSTDMILLSLHNRNLLAQRMHTITARLPTDPMSER